MHGMTSMQPAGTLVLQIDGSAAGTFVGPLTISPTGQSTLAYTCEGTCGGLGQGNASGLGTINLTGDPATLRFGPAAALSVRVS